MKFDCSLTACTGLLPVLVALLSQKHARAEAALGVLEQCTSAEAVGLLAKMQGVHRLSQLLSPQTGPQGTPPPELGAAALRAASLQVHC